MTKTWVEQIEDQWSAEMVDGMVFAGDLDWSSIVLKADDPMLPGWDAEALEAVRQAAFDGWMIADAEGRGELFDGMFRALGEGPGGH